MAETDTRANELAPALAQLVWLSQSEQTRIIQQLKADCDEIVSSYEWDQNVPEPGSMEGLAQQLEEFREKIRRSSGDIQRNLQTMENVVSGILSVLPTKS